MRSGTVERAALTTIYYLLESGQVSRWHVVAADESWHFHEGAPLELMVYTPATRALATHRLGSTIRDGEPVAVVPRDAWQAARPTGDYSLVSCSVGPGFEFEDFRFVLTLEDHAGHFEGAMRGLRPLL